MLLRRPATRLLWAVYAWWLQQHLWKMGPGVCILTRPSMRSPCLLKVKRKGQRIRSTLLSRHSSLTKPWCLSSLSSYIPCSSRQFHFLFVLSIPGSGSCCSLQFQAMTDLILHGHAQKAVVQIQSFVSTPTGLSNTKPCSPHSCLPQGNLAH